MLFSKSLKLIIFVLILVITIIFAGCGGTAPPINNNSEDISEEYYEQSIGVFDLSEQKLNEIMQDPPVDIDTCLAMLGDYLVEQKKAENNVESYEILGNTLKIIFDSGLFCTINLFEEGSGVLSGGNLSKSENSYFTDNFEENMKETRKNTVLFDPSKDDNEQIRSRDVEDVEYIGNRSVMIWSPFHEWWNDFPTSGYLKSLTDIFDDSDQDFNVVPYLDHEADVDSLKEMTDYGIVILFTHGSGISIVTGEIAFKGDEKYSNEEEEGIMWISKDIVISHDLLNLIEVHEPRWSVSVLWFEEKLSNEFPNTIIFNNSCKNGTAGFFEYFREKGAAAYYGHDNDATTFFATKRTKETLQRLVDGMTTGDAYFPDSQTYPSWDNTFSLPEIITNNWVTFGKKNVKIPNDIAMGYISGSVEDAATQSPLYFVSVEVYDGNDLISTGTTDLSGNYYLTVPSGSDYTVEFSLTDYDPTTYYNVPVLEDAVTYLNKVLLVASVGDVNHPPEITSTVVTSATKAHLYSYDVDATDSDVGDSLTYSLTNKPTGMSINSTGVITWTPTSIGDYDVTVKVEDDGSPVLSDTQSFTITVEENYTYTITASAGSHGSISPSGSITVNQGSDKSFTITPDTGYQIDDVLVDGSSVGPVSSYTFTNVTENHTISATFNLIIVTNPVHNLTKDTYYTTIQSALDDADNDNTIEVADGTYNENINFNRKNITLQSTNPNDPDVVASTIIDGGRNGSVVIFTGGETRQAVLKGLTIQNGNSEPGAGGGIMINNSSPTISDNIVRWNIANSDNGGGGIFIAHSASPLIEDNTIDGNQGGFGGGIYVGDNSSPTIRNNTIENNLAETHRGGGIFISGSSSPIIQDNSLSDNSSQYGGGICIVESSSGEISNNYFTLNTAQYGGGIFCGEDSDPIIKQNEFYKNNATSFGGGLFIGECVVNNNVISGNTAQTGGGIFVWESSPTISDNTISGNTTTMSGGGIYLRSNSHPTINNNIISLNTTNRDGGGLYIDDSSSVKTTNGSTWPRQNTPPNTEATNTYFGNTHGNPLDYTEGADVYMVGAITPPPDVESPTVITVKVDNITTTSARLYGNITNTGGENCNERGFVLQDLTSGTVVGTIYTTGSYPTGEYYQTKTGLTSGHTYRFAAYADNSHGTGTGDWVEFTTTP